MKPIQNAGGHVGLTAREYPIAYNTAIAEGCVVKLSGGKVVKAAQTETGAILGIAAENHGGAADVLNPRADGTVILVYDNPELIFECDAPVFEASGGSSTTVTASTTDVACTTADAFNGALLKSPTGKIREVTDFANSTDTNTFTVASGETAAAGDMYILFPFVGQSAGWALDTAIAKIILSSSGATRLKCVGVDTARNKIRLMAVEHALGVEN